MGLLKTIGKITAKVGSKAVKAATKEILNVAKEVAVPVAKDSLKNVALPAAKNALKQIAKDLAKDTLSKSLEADQVRRDSKDMSYAELLESLKDKDISEAQRVGYIAAWKEKHKK